MPDKRFLFIVFLTLFMNTAFSANTREVSLYLSTDDGVEIENYSFYILGSDEPDMKDFDTIVPVSDELDILKDSVLTVNLDEGKSYFRLYLILSGKSLESNTFFISPLASTYSVNIGDDHLMVELNMTGLGFNFGFAQFAKALIIVLLLELLLAVLFLLIQKINLKRIYWFVVVKLVSFSVFWIGFAFLPSAILWKILIPFLIMIVIDIIGIRYLLKKEISWGFSTGFAIASNIFCVLVGAMVLLYINLI